MKHNKEKPASKTAMMETQIDDNYLNPKKMNFKTNYNAVSKKTTPGGKKMTVPGQALTNTEHIKRAKLGLSDQAVKVIYDPDDLFPDISALDIVDQRALLKHARQVVQDIRAKGEEYRAAHKKETDAARAKKDKDFKDSILTEMNKPKSA